MPVCYKCNQQWSWLQTLKKASFTLGDGIECPYCQEKQYISACSRKRNSVYSLITMFPFLIMIPLNLSLRTTFIFVIIIGLILMSINPFLIKLSNQEEPLF